VGRQLGRHSPFTGSKEGTGQQLYSLGVPSGYFSRDQVAFCFVLIAALNDGHLSRHFGPLQS
jgi:hypothetical protein